MRKLLTLALIVVVCAALRRYLKPKPPVSEIVTPEPPVAEEGGLPVLAELDIEQATQIRIPNQIIARVEAEFVTQEPTPDESSYLIIPDSDIKWMARRVGGEHQGTLTIQEGWIDIEAGQATQGKVIFDMDSIYVQDYIPGLLDHLKGTEFFDIYTYPRASFTMTRIAGSNITGVLTIKDISKTITFPAVIITDEKDVIVDAEFAFNRKERNIMGGGPAASDFIELSFTLRFTKK